MAKMTLRDIPILGKTILLRADFNVPWMQTGISRTTRGSVRPFPPSNTS
jgi:3-phosphoglycerate kinase